MTTSSPLQGGRLGILVGGGPRRASTALSLPSPSTPSPSTAWRSSASKTVSGTSSQGSKTHNRKLTVDDVAPYYMRGGSILGTARTNPAKKEEDMRGCSRSLPTWASPLWSRSAATTPLTRPARSPSASGPAPCAARQQFVHARLPRAQNDRQRLAAAGRHADLRLRNRPPPRRHDDARTARRRQDHRPLVHDHQHGPRRRAPAPWASAKRRPRPSPSFPKSFAARRSRSKASAT